MGFPQFVLALLGMFVAVKGMTSGKEYEYSYKGAMRFFVPDQKDHHSLVSFRSKVLVQRSEDLKFKLMMKDLEIGEIHDTGHDHTHKTHSHRSHDEFEEKPGMFQKNELLSKSVERPFVMTLKMENGNFRMDHMETPVGDSIWSLNMKKGLASFLTLFIPQNDEHTYTSMESTIQGDCRVYWNIQHRPHHLNPEAKVFNISRVVDHEKCTRIAGKMYGPLRANPCVNCESVNTHPLTLTSSAHYDLLGDGDSRKNLVLEHAHGHSEIIHAPYTENGFMTKLLMDQDMVLLETRDATEMPTTGDMEVHKSLNMIFARDDRFKRPLDMKKAPSWVEEYELQIPFEPVVKKFKELTDLHMDEENQIGVFEKKDPAQTFGDLLDMVQAFDYETIEKLFNEIVKTADKEKHHKLETMFVDTIASAGQNAGLQFLMDKFQAGEICSSLLQNFFLAMNRGYKEPTDVGLNTILGFCNSDFMKGIPKMRTNCLLTYTSIVDEFCRIAMFAPPYADPVCSKQQLQNEVFAKTVPEYQVAKTEGPAAMDMYLHMATNLRTHKATDFLATAAHDEDLDIFLRMDAVRGLIMIVPLHVMNIRPKVAELYLDPTQPYELRILAATVILKSNPPLSLLNAMVEQLHYEKSDQLKYYIVSMFREVDQNEHPCFKPIAQHVRYLVPKIMHRYRQEWAQKDKLTSHMHLSAGYDPKYDYGGHSIVSMIMSENSYLPRDLYIGMGDYFANFMYDNMGLTFRQSGFDKLLDKQNSPRMQGTTLGRSLWNFMGKRRVARDAQSNKQEAEDIEKKLNLKTKQYEPMRMDFSLSAFGHDLISCHLNESTFDTIFGPDYKPGELLNQWLKADKDVHRLLTLRDFIFSIPTAMGLPAFLGVRHPAVFSYARKDSSFKFEKDGTMNLKLNRRMMFDGHLHEHFSIALPFSHKFFGIGMDRRMAVNLPLNIDASMNVATGKMSINKDFMLPRDVVNYNFKPFSFIESWTHPELNKEYLFYPEEDVQKFDINVFGETTGVDVKASGYHMPTKEIFSEMKRWYFDSDWRAKLYYLIANPQWNARKLDLRVEPHPTSPSTGRTLDFTLKTSDPEQPDPPSKFEEFTGDLEKAYVKVLNIDETFVSEKERKARLEVRYSFKPDRTEHWLQMYHDNTVFNSKNAKHMKICLNTKMTQTLTDWTKVDKDIAHINDGQHMDVTMDLNYGDDCKTGAAIHADMHYEHSDEQKEWLNDLTNGSVIDDNPYRKMYKTCLKHKEEGILLSYQCHKFLVVTSQLNKMAADVTMKNVKVHENHLLSTLYMRINGRMFPHLMMHYLRPNNTTPGRMHIETVARDTCVLTREVDIKLEAPEKTSIWKAVPVGKFAHWAPRTATHLGQTNLISYCKSFYHRYCDMQKNSVRTFDQALYQVPDNKCYTIVAKDCSVNKLFTLLSKNNDDGHKDILLYLDDQKIEAAITDFKKNSIKINGVATEIAEETTKMVRNERGIVLFTVMNHGQVILIDSNVYGFSVLIGRENVFVQAAQYYRGKLCGLCGDMNLDRQHELHTPDGCHHHTGWSYARNFMVPDDTCAVPDADPMGGAPHCAKK